jgi:uncharacterized protein
MEGKNARIAAIFETALLYCSSQAIVSLVLILASKLSLFELSNNIMPLWRSNPYLTLPYLAAICAGMVLIPLLWESRFRKITLREIGFRMPAMSRGSIILAVLIFIFFLFYSFLLPGYQKQRSLPGTQMIFYYAIAWFVVAFAEEVLYRGILQRRLSILIGKPAGIMIAALIFAVLGHLTTPLSDNLILRFPFGLILGYFYQRSSSLAVPIAMHWMFNMIQAV